jgi:hypothetical protein
MPGFGYNVFDKSTASGSVFSQTPAASDKDGQFKSIRINMGKQSSSRTTYIAYAARLQSNIGFQDGQLVSILLLDDLQSNGVYIKKNTKLSGRGWLVSNRIYVDLGFGNTIILCDKGGNKGVPPDVLKSGGDVRLKQI